jgi:GH15 family glucan-1,4-alpha-glucosidase
MNLYQQSIEIILHNQHANGAYIASPSFPTYAYGWFRDGSFIAYAMDCVGQHESSGRFHRWCAWVIERQADKINTLVVRKEAGEEIDSHECLTARYTLEGNPTGDDWTDFQLDGYGTWLWAVGEHIRLSKDITLLAEIAPALNLILRYLIAFWDSACYDCWEEHLEAVHPYTLAALQAGLEAAAQQHIPEMQLPLTETAQHIGNYLKAHAIHPKGYVRKLIFPNCQNIDSSLPNLVDASLIGLAVPYQNQAITPDVLLTTMQKIETDLYYPGGGVYRYLEDTYYGGGEWVLLGAWLGWYWCRSGQFAKAAEMRAFIEEKADLDGNLPEQVSDHLLAPAYYAEWVARWGEIANPLLWSHAMYLILCEELQVYEDIHRTGPPSFGGPSSL